MAAQNYINATEARNNFFGLLEKVKRSPFPINITVKGVPEAVIMSKEEFDGWIATLETLSDPELMKSIREGDEDIKAGRYCDLDEIIEELNLKNLFKIPPLRIIYTPDFGSKTIWVRAIGHRGGVYK